MPQEEGTKVTEEPECPKEKEHKKRGEVEMSIKSSIFNIEKLSEGRK